MAGTYGVEMTLADGTPLERVDREVIRPVLEEIKAGWAALLEGRPGYFLEDKYWAVGIHARRATDGEEEMVLRVGREQAEAALAKLSAEAVKQFRILGGYKFIEVGPVIANKGKTITYLLEEHPWQEEGKEALPLFLGDDDKDEEAFEVIKQHGGMALLVNREPRTTFADTRLNTPQDARDWLEQLLVRYPQENSPE